MLHGGEERVRIRGDRVIWDPRFSFWYLFDLSRWANNPDADPTRLRDPRYAPVVLDWRPGGRWWKYILFGKYPSEEFRIGEVRGAHIVEGCFPADLQLPSPATRTLHYIRLSLRGEWRTMGIGGDPDTLEALIRALESEAKPSQAEDRQESPPPDPFAYSAGGLAQALHESAVGSWSTVAVFRTPG